VFLSTSLVITGAAAEEGAAALIVGRQRRHRFDLERSAAAPTREKRVAPGTAIASAPRAHVKRRRAVSDAEIKQFSEDTGPPTHWDQGTGGSTKCLSVARLHSNLILG